MVIQSTPSLKVVSGNWTGLLLPEGVLSTSCINLFWIKPAYCWSKIIWRLLDVVLIQSIQIKKLKPTKRENPK